MKRIMTSILVILSIGVANGQEDQMPHRIVLSWEQDPATSVSVTWRLVRPPVAASAQIVRLGGWARTFADSAKTVPANALQIKTSEGKTVTHYTARFSSLQPGTSYAYRVGGESAWSEWNTFRTAADASQPFSFLYLGDVQNDIYSQFSPLARTLYADSPHSRFLLLAGDLVNRGQDDDDWREFFSAFGFITRTMPMLAAAGNHDSNQATNDIQGHSVADPLYLGHFAFPENGPDSPYCRELTYCLDYQCVRLVVLNSNSFRFAPQLSWLDSVLANNSKSWTVVCFHHPVYSTGGDRDNAELRAAFAPLFEKHGVDLVLQGHDHRYGRTGKILQNRMAPDGAKAPIYIVSVSGPKMYQHNNKFAHLMRREVGETQLYQIITVNPLRLEFVCKSLDGRVVDSFVLQKQNKGKRLIESPR
jgi:hypothetical protein